MKFNREFKEVKDIQSNFKTKYHWHFKSICVFVLAIPMHFVILYYSIKQESENTLVALQLRLTRYQLLLKG